MGSNPPVVIPIANPGCHFFLHYNSRDVVTKLAILMIHYLKIHGGMILYLHIF